MVWHNLVALITTEERDSREKTWIPGPVLPGGDWTIELPTHNWATNTLLTPENFVQIGPSNQRLFMSFWNTDRQSNKSPLYHRWVRGIFLFALKFLPFHSLHFIQYNPWLKCNKIKIVSNQNISIFENWLCLDCALTL